MDRRTGRWLRAIGVAAVLSGSVLMLARPAGAATTPTVPPAPVTAAPVTAPPVTPATIDPAVTDTTTFDADEYTVPTEPMVATPKQGLSGGETALLVALALFGLLIGGVSYAAGWRKRTIWTRRPRGPWYMDGWYRKEPGERGRWF